MNNNKRIYYFLTTAIAILAGLIVGIVLMLFNAIRSLITVIEPSMDEDVDDAKERESKKNSGEN